jgi:hypothetical protein
MQMGFKQVSRRVLLLVLMALLMGQSASAQNTEPMSSSVVLVLKLVSAQRVRPVTGVVVSADGLVLVPADFITDPGEIVVLDGGTDIIAHGRPATIVYRSLPGDLALLSVEGLNRPGVTLSSTDMSANVKFFLEAFPPARHIARGAEPLWMLVELIDAGAKLPLSVSPETPLPYVTGALMDECGYLAGISMASGAQNLGTMNQTTVISVDVIRVALESIQIKLSPSNCVIPEMPVADKADIEDDKLSTTVKQEEPGPEAGTVEPTPQPSADAAQSDDAIPAGLTPAKQVERPSLWRSVPWWLLVSGFAIVAVLIWKLLFFFLPGKAAASPPQPASDEPDTVQLQSTSESSIPGPRSGHIDESALPDMNDLPTGCNGLVIFEGLLEAGSAFRRFCGVDVEHFDIIIGRGDADIRIEHTTISRNHARIVCKGTSMTLSDLDSSNGTYINGVPCLKREIMFVQRGDEICLGDIRFNIRLVSKEAGLS